MDALSVSYTRPRKCDTKSLNHRRRCDSTLAGLMANLEQPNTAAAEGFQRTHWSLVLAANQGDSPEAEAAMGRLCQAYWYPVYAFIRRRGHDVEPAKDLTQEFFSRLLAKQ